MKFSPENLKFRLQSLANEVEAYLQTSLEMPQIPNRLRQSMQYSLMAGGKRLRPVLCMTSASLCGMPPQQVLPFAAAIEMLHTYSLIHDDLPAMDNDDLRRGKPSNHKAFDEATAILAGDALLTETFACISKMDLPAERLLKAIHVLATSAGACGMVGGQQLDMQFTNEKNVPFESVKLMHSMKTGALIKAACICGGILAGASESLLNKLSAYGKYFGLAFQIADDILDVVGNEEIMGKPVNSDNTEGKNTYPSLLGLEKAQSLAMEAAESAKKALGGTDGEDSAFLCALADFSVSRVA